MNKHVQIRNIPDSLHRRLKARAASQGLSLSDFLRMEMELIAQRPTMKEWVEMVRARERIDVSAGDSVRAIREGRLENDAKLDRYVARKP